MLPLFALAYKFFLSYFLHFSPLFPTHFLGFQRNIYVFHKDKLAKSDWSFPVLSGVAESIFGARTQSMANQFRSKVIKIQWYLIGS